MRWGIHRAETTFHVIHNLKDIGEKSVIFIKLRLEFADGRLLFGGKTDNLLGESSTLPVEAFYDVVADCQRPEVGICRILLNELRPKMLEFVDVLLQGRESVTKSLCLCCNGMISALWGLTAIWVCFPEDNSTYLDEV